VQKKTSWLGRVIQPLTKEINDEIKCTKQVKTKPHILAIVIDFLEQFIQKTAVPAMQKYEQLKREYGIDKKKWKNQVEALKRQNYTLKLELKEISLAYKDATRELADFKLRYSQTHSKIEVNTQREKSQSIISVSSISSFDIEQNTCTKVWNEQSDVWTATVACDKEPVPVNQSDSSPSCKVYCASQKSPALKVRRPPKTQFLNPVSLRSSDSWSCQIEDPVTNHCRDLWKEEEMRLGVNLDKITSEDIVQRLKHIKQRQSEGCNESITQVIIKSKWL
jgi:hypothetical protein